MFHVCISLLFGQNKVQKTQESAVLDTSAFASERPRRKAALPSRFRDSVAGVALENLEMESIREENCNRPSIVVAGENSNSGCELPIALNIEILEQDGHFILQGMEHFEDFKTEEPSDEKMVRGPTPTDVFSSSNFSDIKISLQSSSSISNNAIVTANSHAVSADSSSSVQEDSLNTSQETLTLCGDQKTVTLHANIPQLVLSQNSESKSFLFNEMSSSLPHLTVPCSLSSSNNSVCNKNSSSLNYTCNVIPSSTNNPFHSSPSVSRIQTNISESLHSRSSVSASPPHGKRALSLANEKVKRGPKRKARFKCHICEKTFLKEGRYLRHLHIHGKVIMHCFVCKQKFEDQSQLQNHQKITGHKKVAIEEVHDEEFLKNELRCDVCPNRTFSSKEGFERHMTSLHSGQGKPLQCEHCQKSFIYSHSLNFHLTVCPALHDEERYDPQQKHPCPMCPKVFRHLSSLNYHLDSSHNPERVFVCSTCGAFFKHRQILQRHQAVHSNDRPYECGTCHKTFKTRCNLMNHAAIHNAVKKYTCELCGKQFNHITSITTHLKSHRGEKQFACEYCDKKFVQKGNLREHERIHTGEKPFECGICKKRFTTSSQVKYHARVHNKSQNISEHQKHKKASKVSRAAVNENFTPSSSQQNNNITNACYRCGQTFPSEEAINSHRCMDVANSSSWFVASDEPSSTDTISVDADQNNIVYFLSNKQNRPH